jgi:putative inorganic carbon (hco3(-)) transporter
MTNALPLTLPVALSLIACGLAVGIMAYRAPWTSGAAIAATAPFAWYHSLGPTLITLPKAVFVGALAGVLLRAAFDPSERDGMRGALFADRAPLVFVAFAAFGLMSITWASGRADAVRDALHWTWYAGAFCLTAATARTSADAMRVAVVFLGSSVVVGLDGLWQTFAGAPDVFRATDGLLVQRVTSTLEGPNQFGAYLETVIPILLAILLFSRVSRLAFIAGTLLLGLLTSDLLLTFSRGAFWACAAGVCVVVAAYIWAKRYADSVTVSSLPKRGAVVAASVALFVIPVAGANIPLDGLRHELLATPSATYSMAARAQLWQCAESLIATAPVKGYGAGNFADANARCANAPRTAWHGNANQLYLETAVDLGMVGLAILIAFLSIMLLRARCAELWASPVAVGAYAALFALCLHGLVDDVFTFPKMALPFFVAIALIPAMRRAPEPRLLPLPL